jgi:hypothetical protein
MGCCGQRRAGNARPQGVTRSSEAPAVAHPSVALRYVESAPIFAQGPVSGRQYRFSAEQRVQSVDIRDAPALLRTGFFQQMPTGGWKPFNAASRPTRRLT